MSGISQIGTAAVGKPKRLWKVGELIRHTGLTRQTLHNWCQLGLICESVQTESGHRLYDATVFARLERIQRLRRKGKGLQEIARLLDRRKKQQSEDEKAGG